MLDEQGNPVPNPARNTWVTQTALGTALNQAYFGERVAFFGIVVGGALLLAGIGFIVLTIGGALRQRVEPPPCSPPKPGPSPWSRSLHIPGADRLPLTNTPIRDGTAPPRARSR